MNRPHIISALPTPFTADGALDTAAFESVLEHVAPHVDAVFVAGTTGEFPGLTRTECGELFTRATAALGPDAVIAHIGAPSLHQTLRLLDAAASAGIRTFSAITPYYFSYGSRTILEYYADLSRQVEEESLFAYLFPERSSNDLDAKDLTEVLALPGVTGVKLSGAGNAHLTRELITAHPGSQILTGNDGILPLVSQLGGAGIVSGCSAAFPEVFAAQAKAVVANDEDEARRCADAVREIVTAVGPSIAALKLALRQRTGHAWHSRMPFDPLSAAAAKRVEQALARNT